MDKNKLAVEVFNKRAQTYCDKYMNVDQYADTFNFFCDSIKKENPNILELACGPGNITRYLLKKRPDFKILGIDLAVKMIELAKGNNSNAEFKVMDCRNIKQVEVKYDGIMCGFGLPYLSREEAIKLISDSSMLLNNKGFFYVSTMEDLYNKSLLQTSSLGDKLYMYYHECDYLIKALEENNFIIKNITRKNHDTQDVKTRHKDLIIIAEYNGSK